MSVVAVSWRLSLTVGCLPRCEGRDAGDDPRGRVVMPDVTVLSEVPPCRRSLRQTSAEKTGAVLNALIMVALWNRADNFILSFVLSFFLA